MVKKQSSQAYLFNASHSFCIIDWQALPSSQDH